MAYILPKRTFPTPDPPTTPRDRTTNPLITPRDRSPPPFFTARPRTPQIQTPARLSNVIDTSKPSTSVQKPAWFTPGIASLAALKIPLPSTSASRPYTSKPRTSSTSFSSTPRTSRSRPTTSGAATSVTGNGSREKKVKGEAREGRVMPRTGLTPEPKEVVGKKPLHLPFLAGVHGLQDSVDAYTKRWGEFPQGVKEGLVRECEVLCQKIAWRVDNEVDGKVDEEGEVRNEKGEGKGYRLKGGGLVAFLGRRKG